MQGGWEVQAGPSGTATPACGARGTRPLFALLLRDCGQEYSPDRTHLWLCLSMCTLSRNKTRVCLMGVDQDSRDVKRVTGACNQISDLVRWTRARGSN